MMKKAVCFILCWILPAFFLPAYAQTASYRLDYERFSPIIEEIADESVIRDAKKVIDAFLRYETHASVTGNKDTLGYLNELGYVLSCACPPFIAYTDFNGVTSYDKKSKTVSWTILLEEAEFFNALRAFEETVNRMLEKVNPSDCEAFRALNIYLSLTENASYDYALDQAGYDRMDPNEYNYRASAYSAIMNKSGICYSFSEALVFLYAQADIAAGTVMHHGGKAAHMWAFALLDGAYYYLDPTWDVSAPPKHFGMTAEYRMRFAGGFSSEEGQMLNTVVPEAYPAADTRFEQCRSRLPVEVTSVEISHDAQTVTFFGHDYSCTWDLNP